MLYTAQFRYSGPYRLDITVKSAVGWGAVFAPTWEMVRAYKRRNLNPQDFDNEYASQYYALLISRYSTNEWAFKMLHDKAVTESVTVVCFCRKGNFCHRYLLCDFMRHNWGTPLGGERCI